MCGHANDIPRNIGHRFCAIFPPGTSTDRHRMSSNPTITAAEWRVIRAHLKPSKTGRRRVDDRGDLAKLSLTTRRDARIMHSLAISDRWTHRHRPEQRASPKTSTRLRAEGTGVPHERSLRRHWTSETLGSRRAKRCGQYPASPSQARSAAAGSPVAATSVWPRNVLLRARHAPNARACGYCG